MIWSLGIRLPRNVSAVNGLDTPAGAINAPNHTTMSTRLKSTRLKSGISAIMISSGQVRRIHAEENPRTVSSREHGRKKVVNGGGMSTNLDKDKRGQVGCKRADCIR
jgi:hypothetical protein